MSILITSRCPSARFKKIVDGKPQYSKNAAGLLVLEEADGVYTVSFAEETSDLMKKTFRIAKESSDMLPDALKITGRFGIGLISAFFKGGSNAASSARTASGIKQDYDSMIEKLDQHKTGAWGLLAARKPVCTLSENSKAEWRCWKKNSSLILHPNAGDKPEVLTMLFVFNYPGEAGWWVNQLKSVLPGLHATQL